MSDVLSHALSYAARGWRVVPIHARDKRPHPKAWQRAATTDEEVIEQWWDQWPDANVGVVWGKDSNIIDIECDSPEAEVLLHELFGDEIPITCTYTSTRGKHRLFQWSSDLPFPDKAVFKIGKDGDKSLEFRTGNGEKGAQSVMPPSIHATGAVYRWLPGLSPEDVEPATLDDAFFARLSVYALEGLPSQNPQPQGKPRKPDGHWERLATEGVKEGDRNNQLASYVGKLLRSMRDPTDKEMISVNRESVLSWNATRLVPPLPIAEVVTTFNSILSREQRAFAERKVEAIASTLADTSPDTGDTVPNDWRLEMVDCEPRRWRLYSPWWKVRSRTGYVEFTTDALYDWRLFCKVIADSVQVKPPNSFRKAWEGFTPKDGPEENGLLSALLLNCTTIEESPDKNQFLILADLVYAILSKAKAGTPDDQGYPRIDQDESIWWRPSALRSELSTRFSAVPVAKEDRMLSKLLDRIGCEDRRRKVSTGYLRFRRLTREAFDILKELALKGSQEALPTNEREPGDEPEFALSSKDADHA